MRRGLQVLALLTAVALVSRWQGFGNPVLEFDEQFYLLVGDRMWHGLLPYIDIFDRKPFGLFAIYAAIRGLGGEGVVQYQLVATGFALATAWLIYRFARRIAPEFGAVAAAIAYLLWLVVNEGEGGQTPVFFNLAVIGAAMLSWDVFEGRRRLVLGGVAAMALVGLAIQIKYTAVVEGIFFGLILIGAAWRRSLPLAQVIGLGIVWAATALLPTMLVGLFYASRGGFHIWWFTNFQSQFGRDIYPLGVRLVGLAAILGLLVPLLVCVRAVGAEHDQRTGRFIWGWLSASFVSLFVFGSFLSTHYGLPILVPLTIAAAPLFAARKRIAVALLVVVFVAGQGALAVNEWAKGGRREAMLMAKAARPTRGCIYIYDSYPALYQLTHSCLPTRYAFPGHLNTSDEGNARALGVDPVAEVRRILATRPEVIVDDAPIYRFANLQTRALLNAALARDYIRTFSLRTGTARYRMVYRLKGTR